MLSSLQPRENVERLAKIKAEHVLMEDETEVILTADTIVAYNKTIFAKPQDKAEAISMLQTLSGNVHDVYTAVAFRTTEKTTVFSVKTEVEIWELSDAEITAYVNTDEPYDKAGAYGIQGAARLFIKRINGDYYNVVGLPISYVARHLTEYGFPLKQFF